MSETHQHATINTQQLLQTIKDNEKTKVTDCATASFVGGFIPHDRGSMYVSAAKEAMQAHQVEDEEMRQLVSKDHFRKKYWLKNYFEEECKTKLLLKSKGAAPAAAAAEKKK